MGNQRPKLAVIDCWPALTCSAEGHMNKLNQGDQWEQWCLPFNLFHLTCTCSFVISKQNNIGRTSSLNC